MPKPKALAPAPKWLGRNRPDHQSKSTGLSSRLQGEISTAETRMEKNRANPLLKSPPHQRVGATAAGRYLRGGFSSKLRRGGKLNQYVRGAEMVQGAAKGIGTAIEANKWINRGVKLILAKKVYDSLSAKMHTKSKAKKSGSIK